MTNEEIRALYVQLGGPELEARRAFLASHVEQGRYEKEESPGEKIARLLRGEAQTIEGLRAPAIPAGEPNRKRRQRMRDKAMRYKARKLVEVDNRLAWGANNIIRQIACTFEPEPPAGSTQEVMTSYYKRIESYEARVVDALAEPHRFAVVVPEAEAEAEAPETPGESEVSS